jgi:hypothetical protein
MKWSILVSGLLIAAAIMLSNRFQVTVSTDHGLQFHQVDHLTGAVSTLRTSADGGLIWTKMN